MQPFTTDVKAELEKRIRELIEFANEYHISAPDLLWNIAAIAVANMHPEVRKAMRVRLALPFGNPE